MAIWKRIKKSTPEQEAEFKERMSNENVPLTDKLVMILTAFVIIVIPSALFLTGLCLLVMWILGLL